nr:MAG TPA: hypothetical protein [Caudoviricetes sp.]
MPWRCPRHVYRPENRRMELLARGVAAVDRQPGRPAVNGC